MNDRIASTPLLLHPALFLTFLFIFSIRRYDTLKSQGLKEERLLLLESWRDAEQAALQTIEGEELPSREHLSAVESKFPRKIKMKRAVLAEDGFTELGQEEYFDYIFPDDEKKIGTLTRLCVLYVCVVCVVFSF